LQSVAFLRNSLTLVSEFRTALLFLVQLTIDFMQSKPAPAGLLGVCRHVEQSLFLSFSGTLFILIRKNQPINHPDG
jgi:hypothetical protein